MRSGNLLRSPRFVLAVTGGLIALLFLVAVLHRGTPPPPFKTDEVPPTPLVAADGRAAFVGSEACRECHRTEFEEHNASLHAHTFAAADTPEMAKHFASNQELKDPTRGVSYTFHLQDGKPVTRVKDLKTGKLSEISPQHAVGSGKYGTTFVYSRNGSYMETRASYYGPMKKWYWTPGQQDPSISRLPEGRILDRDETVKCFLCHGTVVVQSDNEPIEPTSLMNVGCERCHGPGAEHVAAARRGNPRGGLFTYSKASSGTVTQLCSQCHRAPSNDVLNDLDRDPNLPRFAGTALAASQCYKKSPGKLDCVTCHNPHQPVSTEPAYYEKICKSCHEPEKPEQQACPVNPQSGCIPCHMPAQSINFPGGAKFHNHRIKPYSQKLVSALNTRKP